MYPVTGTFPSQSGVNQIASAALHVHIVTNDTSPPKASPEAASAFLMGEKITLAITSSEAPTIARLEKKVLMCIL